MNTCRKGLHDLTDEVNVIRKPDGHRQCLPCQREANRAAGKRRYRGDPPMYPRLPAGQTTCSVEGCDHLRHRGSERYCHTHSLRLGRWGDLFADVPIGYKKGASLPDMRAELTG